MDRKINILATLLLVCIVTGGIFIGTGCAKADEPMTIRGRMVKDCALAPLSRQSLHINYYDGQVEKNMGTDRTGPDGSFEIRCEHSKSGRWTLVNEGVATYDFDKSKLEAGILDLGNVMATATYNAGINIAVKDTLAADDTLYLVFAASAAEPAVAIKTIFPVTATAYRETFSYDAAVTSISYLYPPHPYTLWWGIGKVQAEQRADIRMIHLYFDICGRAVPETVVNIFK